MLSRIFFSLVLVLLAVKAPVASASTISTANTTIGTTGSPNVYGSFGTLTNTAFGESMSSPGGVLTSLTFSSIQLYNNYGSNARLVIASMTGTTPSAALYSQQYTLTTGSNTFSNLNVATTAGLNYFAYLTVDGVSSNAVKYATFGAMTPGSNYAGGAFYYGDQGCNAIVDYTSLSKYDLAFSATFTTPTPAVAVTPEPSSLMLLATGLGSTVTMLRRRKVSIA